MMPNVQDIMDWEQGNMSREKEIIFFQKLINSGLAWKLQGCYGRRAVQLIEEGLCFTVMVASSSPRKGVTQ